MSFFYCKIKGEVKKYRLKNKEGQRRKSMFCMQCGSELDENGKFCEQCGREILNNVDRQVVSNERILKEPISTHTSLVIEKCRLKEKIDANYIRTDVTSHHISGIIVLYEKGFKFTSSNIDGQSGSISFFYSDIANIEKGSVSLMILVLQDGSRHTLEINEHRNNFMAFLTYQKKHIEGIPFDSPTFEYEFKELKVEKDVVQNTIHHTDYIVKDQKKEMRTIIYATLAVGIILTIGASFFAIKLSNHMYDLRKGETPNIQEEVGALDIEDEVGELNIQEEVQLREEDIYEEILIHLRATLEEVDYELRGYQIDKHGFPYQLSYFMERKEDIGFELVDINEDGIKEMLIGDMLYDQLLMVYTIAEGKAIQLICGEERNRYDLTAEFVLLNSGSSSASESCMGSLEFLTVINGEIIWNMEEYWYLSEPEGGGMWYEVPRIEGERDFERKVLADETKVDAIYKQYNYLYRTNYQTIY